MSAVLTWIKSNLMSVIFVVVMIASLVALPLVSGRLNAGIQEDMKKRVSQLKELRQLEKTSVTVGNPALGEQISDTVLVNEMLLERLREVAESEGADADLVRKAAREHNQRGRGVLLPALFPEPPASQREVIPERFHRIVVAAYDDLLERVNAGSPPDTEMLVAEIERRKAQFLSQTLQKDVDDPLDEDEAQQLEEVLTRQRISKYAEEAERIAMYCGTDALAVPQWFQASQPSMSELFEWQWQYWIVEDVLEALAEANAGSGSSGTSVPLAPMKRVLEITVLAHAGMGGAPSGGGGGGSPGFGPRGGGSDRDGPRKIGRPDPTKEVKLDFSTSFTGRSTNALYDVRHVVVRLVVETSRLPVVLDAIARRNFMTITDLDIMPADHYSAAAAGYFYGAEPVSEVTLELETIWLRSWTGPFMPPELRAALGVPDPEPDTG